MGQTGSYTAKASAGPLFRPFTTWGLKHLRGIMLRSDQEFSDIFALRKQEVR